MLTSTSNERDRPSLSLPRAQAVADVLQAFGWRPSRPDPATTRDAAPTVIQPAILSNSPVGTWVTRLAEDHAITDLALKDQPVEELVETLFVRVLTRPPTQNERAKFVAYLSDGYAARRTGLAPEKKPHAPEPYASWSNHHDPEATYLKQRLEAAARAGDPPTVRLAGAWRAKLEDVLWALLNSPEFVFVR
jgi:hypothetical protein